MKIIIVIIIIIIIIIIINIKTIINSEITQHRKLEGGDWENRHISQKKIEHRKRLRHLKP